MDGPSLPLVAWRTEIGAECSISRQWRHRWALSRTRIDQGRSGRRYGRLYVGDGVFCLLGSRHSQLILSLIRAQAPTLQRPSPNLATAIAKSANLAQIRTNALQNLAQNSAGRRRTNAVAIGGELRTYRVVTEVGADIYAKDDDGWTNAAALAAKYGHFKS